MSEISCKRCGCLDKVTQAGKGPHAYEMRCLGCGGHIKWLSKYDVEEFSDDDLLSKHHTLTEFVCELAGRVPLSHYIAKEKELERVNKLIKKRGLKT